MRQDFELATTSDDLRKVIRALEPIVAGAMTPPLKAWRGYHVAGDSATIHDELDLDKALVIFPGSPTSLSRRYQSERGLAPTYEVNLSSSNYLSNTVYVTVDVTGPSSHETVGLVEHLRNMITKEVARQDGSGWTAEPILFPGIPATPAESSAIPAVSEKPWIVRLWDGATTHPFWSVIITGIIIGVMVALITSLLHLNKNGNDSPRPSTSTSQPTTSTSQTESPAATPGSVDTNQPRTRGDDQPTHAVAPGLSQG